MKKVFLLAGFYCLHLCTYAQSSTSQKANFSNKSMKSIDRPQNADIPLATASVNARAIRDFRETYPGVQNEMWATLPNKEISCMFRQPGIVTHIFYSRHGRKRCTVTGYDESNLGKEVRDQVLSNYPGYHISYVNEIDIEGLPTTYVINIEDAGHIKVIRVADDEMDVLRDLEKQ